MPCELPDLVRRGGILRMLPSPSSSSSLMTVPDFVLGGGLRRPEAALWVELFIPSPDFVLTGGLRLKLPDLLREPRELPDPGSIGSLSPLRSEPVFNGTTIGGPKS